MDLIKNDVFKLKANQEMSKKLLDPEESLISHSVDAVCFMGNMRLICVQYPVTQPLYFV